MWSVKRNLNASLLDHNKSLKHIIEINYSDKVKD